MRGRSRELKDMVVVITGASSGIGEALARELSDRGCKLVLSARRETKLRALNDELGGHHTVLPADVAVPNQCRWLARQSIGLLGRIDTFVANAGIGLSKPAIETTDEELDRLFAVNVGGTHNACFAAGNIMTQQTPRDGCRGQLVVVSSAVARRALPYFGPYAATKAAQLSLAESMRIELASHDIAVTSVHPVGTSTDFFEVAEKAGTVKVQDAGGRGLQQSPQTVARKIVKAIRRPRREVWPAVGSRLLLTATASMPWLGDFFCRQMKKKIDASQ